MLPDRLRVVHRVEGDDACDERGRDADLLRDLLHRPRPDEPLLLLRHPERRKKGGAAIGVDRDRPIDLHQRLGGKGPARIGGDPLRPGRPPKGDGSPHEPWTLRQIGWKNPEGARRLRSLAHRSTSPITGSRLAMIATRSETIDPSAS